MFYLFLFVCFGLLICSILNRFEYVVIVVVIYSMLCMMVFLFSFRCCVDIVIVVIMMVIMVVFNDCFSICVVDRMFDVVLFNDLGMLFSIFWLLGV